MHPIWCCAKTIWHVENWLQIKFYSNWFATKRETFSTIVAIWHKKEIFMKMSFQITTQTHALLVSFLCVKYFKTPNFNLTFYPNFAQIQHMCSFLHVLIKRVPKIQFITLLFTAFQYHITFNLIFISYLFWHVAEIGMYQV